MVDERRAEAALAGARSIDRVRRGEPRTQSLGLDGRSLAVVSMFQDSESLVPAVHGWSEGERLEGTALVSEGGSRLRRDIAGTRPLFLASDGTWAASDWRFFRGEGAQLLLPGSLYDLSTGVLELKKVGHEEFQGSFEDAAKKLARALEDSIRGRVKGYRKVAVAFSGGIDSAILACVASKATEVVACVGAARGSRDFVGAKVAADLLGIELRMFGVDSAMIRDELRGLDLPFSPSPMDRSLWCLYSIVSRGAAESGAQTILLGQLSDELFAGYAKYVAAGEEGAASRMMESDFEACGERGLVRDEAACSRCLQPAFPFAEQGVVRLARSLPMSFKIRDRARKAVLREAARSMGVPEELAGAEKKAAQYSSGIQKLV